MGARVRFVGIGKNIPANQMNQHKKSVPIQAREVIRVSDIILEVLDARFIAETRNTELENEIIEKGKKIIFVVNKADLVEIDNIKEKLDNIKPYVLVSCKKNIGRQRLRDTIKIEVKRLRKNNKDMLKDDSLVIGGMQKEIFMKAEKRAQVGIIGYPNTGKSSLTNILTGSGAANASSESGFTKGIQKIRFTKDILILDTPGLISENEISLSAENMKKHGIVGAKAYDKIKEPEMILNEIVINNPEKIERFYGLKENGDSELIVDELGKKWGFLKKKGVVDSDRVARKILKDWQEGKIK